MTTSKQQFVDAFSALQYLDQDTELDAYIKQYETIIKMLDIEGIPEDEIFILISELFDPDYGIGHQVPEPYAAEQITLRRLLRAGDRQNPHTIMPNIVGLVAIVNNDDSSTEFDTTIAAADLETIVALHNIADVFYSAGKIRDHKAVVMAVCGAMRALLSTHYEEGGEAAMLSVLRRIADKWAALPRRF